VMAIEEALTGGADEVVVADANADDPILSALDGGGTHVYASALENGDASADDGAPTDDADADESESDTSEEE